MKSAKSTRIKSLLAVLVLLASTILPLIPLHIHAAPSDRYWVGGDGNTNDTAHWDYDDGGAGGDPVPDSETDVFFNANSGFVPGHTTVTVNAALSCHDMDWTGVTNTPYITGVGSLSIYGSLTLVSGMSIDTGTWNFKSTTAGNTITTVGKEMRQLVFNGVGGEWTLLDNLTTGGGGAKGEITVTNGTFNVNGKTLTMVSSGTGAISSLRVMAGGIVNMGAANLVFGTYSCIQNAGALNFDSATGYVTETVYLSYGFYQSGGSVNFGTSNITYLGISIGGGTVTAGTSTITAQIFDGGGKTFYDVYLATSITPSIAGANTFHNLTVTSTAVINTALSLGANQIVSNALVFNGNAVNYRLLVKSNTLHTQRTITCNGTVNAQHTDFQDIIGAGSASWNLSAISGGSGDVGNNSGITFTASKTVYHVGGMGAYNWSANHWASTSGGVASLTNYPIPQDIAIFDTNSIALVGVVLTMDETHLPSINTLAVTNNPTFSATNAYLYGSLKLGTCVWTVTDTYFYMPDLDATLQTTGTIGGNVTFDTWNTGFVALSGDATVTGNVVLLSGVLDLNDYDLTCSTFVASTTTYARTLVMGSGVITLNSTATATKWNMVVGGGGLTIVCETSTIVMTSTGTNVGTFLGAGKTYYNLTIQGSSGINAVAFSDANTFNTIIIDRTQSGKTITGNYRQTISPGGLSIPIVGSTDVTITGVDFTQASGIICSDFLILTNSDAVGGSFYAGANSHDNAGNGVWSFTGCTSPAVTTGVATGLSTTGATLNATITSMGSWGTVYGFFQYDTDGTFTTPSSTSEQPISGIGDYDEVTGVLIPYQTYHFRAVLRYNIASYVYGAAATFVAANPPVVVTADAINLGGTSATLQGSLTEMGDYTPVGVSFEYGLTVAYGSTTIEDTLYAESAFTKDIIELDILTTYHFRAVARYVISGVSYYTYGADNTFTTLRISGGGEIVSVLGGAVFKTYIIDGDLLFTAEVINNYAPYYKVTNPSQYFAIQLLDPTGTTIIAATPLRHWDMSPASIYLSPNSASHITWGGAYIIRMIGLFATPPSDTYILQPEDWKSSDLAELDSWMIATAEDMNVYYEYSGSQSLTTKVSGVGTLLTDEGGAYFTSSISGIMTVRPNIFEITRRSPKYSTGTATNAYDADKEWQEQVGTVIAGDADIIGDVLGIQPKQLLSFGIWAFYLFMVLFVFFNTKGADTPFVLLLNIPVLFIGLNFRIIEFQVFAVASVISVLLWLIKVWFSK
jgi:hypothetical protein